MKTKIIVLVLLLTTTLFSCKQKDSTERIEEIIEEETVSKLPNNSDIEFMNALSLLDQQKGKEAATYLKKGVEELKKEGTEIRGLYKTNLNGAIAKLTTMTTDLENGKSVSEEAIREAIVNAEINIAHNYLTTTDIYVLEEPENVVSNKTKRHFNKMLKNLKREEGKMKEAAKKDGKALLDEGKKLEKELKEWEKKAKAYSKKANEHFKEHYPKYDVPSGE